ncbi:MAG: hypothetical protein ABJA82_01850 [Myxococcales bacterium]
MPKLPTSAEKFAEANRLARQIAELKAQEKAARAFARKIEALERAASCAPAAHVTPGRLKRTGLSPAANYRSLSTTMEHALAASSRAGRPLVSEHLFPRTLKAHGSDVEKWAREKGLPIKRVRSWFASGDGARRIPRDIAESIEREFGADQAGVPVLPATLFTWPNGIR